MFKLCKALLGIHFEDEGFLPTLIGLSENITNIHKWDSILSIICCITLVFLMVGHFKNKIQIRLFCTGAHYQFWIVLSRNYDGFFNASLKYFPNSTSFYGYYQQAVMLLWLPHVPLLQLYLNRKTTRFLW